MQLWELMVKVSTCMCPCEVTCTEHCWLWRYGVDGKGYPRMWYEGGHVSVSRMLWNMCYGKWPVHDVVRRCETQVCVNWNHYMPGAHGSQAKALTQKGKHATVAVHAKSSIVDVFL